ncbi:MAG: multidrug efflux SMR transporter [Desulfobacteraceae bacterium]|jgi:multidrug transporter EmrE-like cation transporter
MSWLFLFFSVLLEAVGTSMLKLADGINNLYFIVLSLTSYGVSFCFMAMVFKAIPMSIAYSIWAGSGAILITLVGVFFFKEPFPALKGLFIFFIITGIVGLKLYEH